MIIFLSWGSEKLGQLILGGKLDRVFWGGGGGGGGGELKGKALERKFIESFPLGLILVSLLLPPLCRANRNQSLPTT